MAKLTPAQKLFVVRRLACFSTPTEIQADLQEFYQVEFSLPGITQYDPTTDAGERLAAELKAEFHAARQRFLENLDAVPAAHSAYRLRKLQALIDQTSDARVVAALLAQAAKERGEAPAPRGKEGGTLPTPVLSLDLSLLTDDELETLERLHLRLAAAAGAAGGGAGGDAEPPG